MSGPGVGPDIFSEKKKAFGELRDGGLSRPRAPQTLFGSRASPGAPQNSDWQYRVRTRAGKVFREINPSLCTNTRTLGRTQYDPFKFRGKGGY